VDPDVALLCNPSAGGGAAARDPRRHRRRATAAAGRRGRTFAGIASPVTIRIVPGALRVLAPA
jgi:diacylglycerol kinase family enzyme